MVLLILSGGGAPALGSKVYFSCYVLGDVGYGGGDWPLLTGVVAQGRSATHLLRMGSLLGPGSYDGWKHGAT